MHLVSCRINFMPHVIRQLESQQFTLDAALIRRKSTRQIAKKCFILPLANAFYFLEKNPFSQFSLLSPNVRHNIVTSIACAISMLQAGCLLATMLKQCQLLASSRAATLFDTFVAGGSVRAKLLYTVLSDTAMSAHFCHCANKTRACGYV